MKFYRCSSCWYVITKIQRDTVRFDYPCPHCGLSLVSSFELVDYGKEEK